MDEKNSRDPVRPFSGFQFSKPRVPQQRDEDDSSDEEEQALPEATTSGYDPEHPSSVLNIGSTPVGPSQGAAHRTLVAHSPRMGRSGGQSLRAYQDSLYIESILGPPDLDGKEGRNPPREGSQAGSNAAVEELLMDSASYSGTGEESGTNVVDHDDSATIRGHDSVAMSAASPLTGPTQVSAPSTTALQRRLVEYDPHPDLRVPRNTVQENPGTTIHGVQEALPEAQDALGAIEGDGVDAGNVPAFERSLEEYEPSASLESTRVNYPSVPAKFGESTLAEKQETTFGGVLSASKEQTGGGPAGRALVEYDPLPRTTKEHPLHQPEAARPTARNLVEYEPAAAVPAEDVQVIGTSIPAEYRGEMLGETLKQGLGGVRDVSEAQMEGVRSRVLAEYDPPRHPKPYKLPDDGEERAVAGGSLVNPQPEPDGAPEHSLQEVSAPRVERVLMEYEPAEPLSGHGMEVEGEGTGTGGRDYGPEIQPQAVHAVEERGGRPVDNHGQNITRELMDYEPRPSRGQVSSSGNFHPPHQQTQSQSGSHKAVRSGIQMDVENSSPSVPVAQRFHARRTGKTHRTPIKVYSGNTIRGGAAPRNPTVRSPDLSYSDSGSPIRSTEMLRRPVESARAASGGRVREASGHQVSAARPSHASHGSPSLPSNEDDLAQMDLDRSENDEPPLNDIQDVWPDFQQALNADPVNHYGLSERALQQFHESQGSAIMRRFRRKHPAGYPIRRVGDNMLLAKAIRFSAFHLLRVDEQPGLRLPPGPPPELRYPTRNNFYVKWKVSIKGSTFNSTAADVLTAYLEEEEEDLFGLFGRAWVRKKVVEHLEYLRRKKKRQDFSPLQLQRYQKKACVYARKQNLFHRRLRTSEAVPRLRKHIPLYRALGALGMSSDESQDDGSGDEQGGSAIGSGSQSGQRLPRVVLRKHWIASSVTKVHKEVDKATNYLSRSTFTRGSFPHPRIREPDRWSSNPLVLLRLRRNIYSSSWLQRLARQDPYYEASLEIDERLHPFDIDEDEVME